MKLNEINEAFAKKTYGPDKPKRTKWRVTNVSLEYNVPNVDITAKFLQDRIEDGKEFNERYDVLANDPIDAVITAERVPEQYRDEAFQDYTRKLRQDGNAYVIELDEFAWLIEPPQVVR